MVALWPTAIVLLGSYPAAAVAQEATEQNLTTVQVLGGAYFDSHVGPKVSSFNYAPIDFRIGRWFACPWFDETLFRGNGEVLIDLMAAPVFSDYGSIVTGPSLLLRYNFTQPEQALVPYVQVGAGFVYNDAFRDREQRAIGEGVEFLLQAGIGCRYVLNPHWTLDVEGGFQHISNAGLAGRNLGANDFGFGLGLTYYFSKGCW
jgi:hypothetical protein